LVLFIGLECEIFPNGEISPNLVILSVTISARESSLFLDVCGNSSLTEGISACWVVFTTGLQSLQRDSSRNKKGLVWRKKKKRERRRIEEKDLFQFWDRREAGLVVIAAMECGPVIQFTYVLHRQRPFNCFSTCPKHIFQILRHSAMDLKRLKICLDVNSTAFNVLACVCTYVCTYVDTVNLTF
jgi:hypothetical protein